MQLTGASSVLHRHPRLRLVLLLAAPMLVLVAVYLGALAVLLLSSFWSTDVQCKDYGDWTTAWQEIKG